MATWREEIESEMNRYNDSWKNVEQCTLNESELDKRFSSGYGVEEGAPFTVWTKDRVYFPICYDGSEWAGSVSRNPNGKPTYHQGGG